MSNRLLVATRKGLFTVKRHHGAWSIDDAQFIGQNLSFVTPDPRDGAVYAAFDHGHFGVKLHRSDDGGGAWTEVETPAYPEPKENEEPWLDYFGKPVPTTLKLIWALQPGGPDQPGRLWCGTIPGGLFRSDDRGDSWQMVTSLWEDPKRRAWMGGGADYPGIHSVCVDPRDSQCVRLGISCGGVWQTDDGGATWACRADGMRSEYTPPDQQEDPNTQDPHLLVQCRSQPDKLWVQHHNGIFRSVDGSTSWTEVTDAVPSVFGFAVAVHPEDGDTAWFVPGVKDEVRTTVGGKLVVSRTRDGGKTFDVLTNGLPQEHAYDLVFRHALDLDESGERLAFGSTTGSLYVSEDQGDSWQCVSEHLPPIYCVRFVTD